MLNPAAERAQTLAESFFNRLKHRLPEGLKTLLKDFRDRCRSRRRPARPDESDPLPPGFALLDTSAPDDSSSPENALRILFAAPWLITGGADTMIVDWFRNLDSAWCEKYFVTTLPRENVWLDKISAYAAGIYDLPAAGCLTRDEMTAFFKECIARKKIDILHIMNSEAAYHALPELKKSFPALKVVAQFHCFDYFPDGRCTGFAFNMPPLYDKYIDCYNLEYPELGDEIRELYPFVAADKFRVIHGRVDSDYFAPGKRPPVPEIAARRREGVLNLIYIGRLDRQKQPVRLLDIAARLKERGVPFFLHVIGEGNLESQKDEFLVGIAEQNLSEVTTWYGEQPLESLYDWYRIADVLLLTSDWEGVPMVLYQALAMEVVPVASAVGGCGELITPECGRLVADPGDIEGYVEALVELVDPDRRRALARAGRERMRSAFALSELDREYREFYQSLMKR